MSEIDRIENLIEDLSNKLEKTQDEQNRLESALKEIDEIAQKYGVVFIESPLLVRQYGEEVPLEYYGTMVQLNHGNGMLQIKSGLPTLKINENWKVSELNEEKE